MMEECDGALIIGDRAISAAISHKGSVLLDLGREWKDMTGYPMVFGVFAARKDSEVPLVLDARNAMMKHYNSFNNDLDFREEVISSSSKKVGFSETRVKSYFENEVSNLLKDDSIKGLRKFLDLVCKVEEPIWIN